MNFSVETILTIITGVAFERGLSNATLLIEHMTGETADEITFLIGDRPNICKQEIVRQHPELKRFLELDGIGRDNYLDVLEWAKGEFGNSLMIEPIQDMPTPEQYWGLI